MAEWAYLSADATPGQAGGILAEIPFDNVRGSTILTGVGTFSGQIPLRHPKCTEEYLQCFNREIVVVRDSKVVGDYWITGCEPSVEDNSVLQVTGHEIPWIYGKRFLEVNKSWTSTDVFTIMRALDSYARTKLANADLYRYSLTAGAAGATKTYGPFKGIERHSILDLMEDLAADTFDWRMTYSGSPEQVTRVLELGYPSLGSDVGRVVEPGAGLVSLGFQNSIEKAANRAHVVGANGLAVSVNNTASIAAGDVLLEELVDRVDQKSSSALTSVGNDYVRRAKPPVSVISATYQPSEALPFDMCEVGDSVTLTADVGFVQVDALRRVVGREFTPATDQVKLTFNEPL